MDGSDIPAATNAIAQFLESNYMFNDDVIRECIELLSNIWHIEHRQIAIQIIQTAAVNVGLLTEAQIN